MDINADFQWKCQPEAEALILNALETACSENSYIAHLSQDLLKHTSTRLFDWLDHVVVGNSPSIEKKLESTGFIADLATPEYRVFNHPGAQLPRVVVRDHDQPLVGIAVSVENIADFLLVRGLSGKIEGAPLSGYRRCCISTDNLLFV